MGKVKFIECTSSEYNSASKNNDTLYFLSDTQEIYKGTVKYTASTPDPQTLRNQMGLGNTLAALPIANGGTGVTSLEARAATPEQYGYVKLVSDEDFKAYMGIA